MSLATVKELKSPIKLTTHIYIKDLVGATGYFVFTFLLGKELITPTFLMRFLYGLNCFIWAIYFLMPNIHNSQIRNWQNILITLSSYHKIIYKPLRKEESDYVPK